MAKSRRNVSRRKRQQKRRNSRRNFRKMLVGGGLVSDVDKDKLIEELRNIGPEKITDEKIRNTISVLNRINSWEEYPIFGNHVGKDTVVQIIENLEKEKEKENNSLNPKSGWF